MIEFIDKVYTYLAFSGTLLILIGVLISIFPFRDRAGERYSLLNHFISELGEKGISKAAWGFNTAMIISGWLYLPLMIMIGVKLASVPGWIGASFGVVACVAASLVGVFSMDRLNRHRKAAMTFFHSGLWCILFFTLAIFSQPVGGRRIPLGLNIVGLLAIASFGSFLLTVYSKPNNVSQPNYILDPNAPPERPKVWRTAILEWCIFFTIQAWFLMAALLSMTR
jgi:hypothetical membrane protein